MARLGLAPTDRQKPREIQAIHETSPRSGVFAVVSGLVETAPFKLFARDFCLGLNGWLLRVPSRILRAGPGGHGRGTDHAHNHSSSRPHFDTFSHHVSAHGSRGLAF